MNQDTIDGEQEIEKVARNILIGSKAWGKFPTPVDQIVSYAELQVASGVDLSKVEPGFFSKSLHSLQRALSKVVAAVDLREKKIFLDLSQRPERQNFNKLHETGHKTLTWQRDTYVHLDDENTLDPDTDELFERQASWFASDALFQLERFEDEAAKLPLTIKSPLALAKNFGGSRHASLRRYVAKSKKRCALLVLEKPKMNGEFCAEIRNYFQSSSFTKEFGTLAWPAKCGLEFQFMQEAKFGARLHEKGQITLKIASGEFISFSYHYFNNTYNVFILLLPPGEKNWSRTTIITR